MKNSENTSGSFLHHALIYGLGNILIYAGNFFLLPIYVRYLSEAEYGVLDALHRIGEVLILCLFYNGLRQALFVFHNQTDDPKEKREVIGSVLGITSLFFLFGGGLLFFWSRPLAVQLGTGSVDTLRLAILTVLLEAFSLLLLALAQARVESTFFVTVSILQFLCRSLLCILFVAVLRLGIHGALLGTLLSSTLFIIILFVRELRKGTLSLRADVMKSMLLFSLPFIPGGIGFFILNSGDRFFLLKHVSKEDLGSYALGYKLALVVRMLTRRPLYQVWSARMYKVAKLEDAPTIFGRVFTRFLAAYVLVGLSLCLLDREVLAILVGNRFQGAQLVISPIVLAYLILTASDLMDSGFYVTRQTKWKLLSTSLATITTVSLYAILIPSMGITGAIISTITGFFVLCGVTFILSQRVFRVEYEWRRLAFVVLSAFAVWGTSRLLPFSWWLIPVKLLLPLLWMALLWFGNVLSDEEKSWGRTAFSHVVAFWERVVSQRYRRRPSLELEHSSQMKEPLRIPQEVGGRN